MGIRDLADHPHFGALAQTILAGPRVKEIWLSAGGEIRISVEASVDGWQPVKEWSEDAAHHRDRPKRGYRAINPRQDVIGEIVVDRETDDIISARIEFQRDPDPSAVDY